MARYFLCNKKYAEQLFHLCFNFCLLFSCFTILGQKSPNFQYQSPMRAIQSVKIATDFAKYAQSQQYQGLQINEDLEIIASKSHQLALDRNGNCAVGNLDFFEGTKTEEYVKWNGALGFCFCPVTDDPNHECRWVNDDSDLKFKLCSGYCKPCQTLWIIPAAVIASHRPLNPD